MSARCTADNPTAFTSLLLHMNLWQTRPALNKCSTLIQPASLLLVRIYDRDSTVCRSTYVAAGSDRIVLHCTCALAVSAVVAVVSWGTLIVTASQLLQRLKKEYHLQSLFTVPAKVLALVLPSFVHIQQPETLVFF